MFFVLWIVAIIYAITVHEFMHAYVGTAQGDDTARASGRVTLNPLAHIDFLGMLFLVFVGFGWGKPVPFNPYNLRNQRWGSFFVAFAGPLSNLVSAAVFGLIMKGLVGGGVVDSENLLILFLSVLIHLNLILFLFNLLPIPPLDGSKIWYGLFPTFFGRHQAALERYGPMVLLGLILVDILLPVSIFGSLFFWVSDVVAILFT